MVNTFVYCSIHYKKDYSLWNAESLLVILLKWYVNIIFVEFFTIPQCTVIYTLTRPYSGSMNKSCFYRDNITYYMFKNN